MTSMDISSVRDFTKTRLRKILIDFYFLSIYPFGPTNENLIDLNTNHRKVIELTNKNLFKNFNAKEYFNLAKQTYEKPNAFIYIKLLNTNKFTKKVGDYLIEFSVFKKQHVNLSKINNFNFKHKSLNLQKSITSLQSSGNLSKFLKQTESLNDLRRLKVNPAIFKSKTIPKEQVKVIRFGLDKIRLLERKIRYGFQRRNFSDQVRKNLKEVFENQINPAILSKTNNSLLNVPPNWNYCKAYELDLNKILNPLDLILKIDIRLLEFIDVNPLQAKIVKMLPLKDLLTDQFLDVVIIKDLKNFYFQMIESIKNQYKAQQLNLDNLLITNNNISINSILNDKSLNLDSNERISFKSISASEEKISNLKKLKIIKKPKKDKFLFYFLRKKNLNNPKQNDIFDDRSSSYKLAGADSSEHKLTETVFKTAIKVKKQTELDHKNNQKIIDNKLNLLKTETDSSVKSTNRKCPNLIPFKLFKLFKNKNLKFKKSSKTINIDNRIKKRKRKCENTAFLSVELQLGSKIEASKEKRLIKCLNHIDMFTVLAIEGKKSYLNFKELKNQSSWRFIYTPFHIFLLNQNKIHSTINALEDAICRTIAIAKIYAKYSRIKNFCHLNSSINDLLYQYSLNSKQIWFTELSQLLEDYLFENLEQIFKAEMPASLMAIYKYNYSKYGEFLFDNQIQLILGVIAIKSSLQSDSNIQIEDFENVFINQESDDETLKDKNKKKKKLNNTINKNEISTGSIGEFTFIGNGKEKRLISSQQFSNAGLSLLGSMARGFERCTKVWMQYMESKKPESNLEELVHFSRTLKNFCIGLVRVFQRQQYLLVKKILIQQKKANLNDDDTNLDQIVKQYLTSPILPRFVLQSLINLHLIIDSHIFRWIPFSLKILIDKLILPVDYDDATDVAKRNAIFQASPYKDIYNSLRVTIEKLQSLHNEPIQLQVTVQTIQGWFPLNVTQAWISEEIQRVECECTTWDEFFKELAFIRSDSKIDKMEKLTDKEKQIKEKEFQEFINDWIIKKLDNIVMMSINEVNQLIDKNDLISSTKFNYLTKTASEIAKDEDRKNNKSSLKTFLNESTTSIINKESTDHNENRNDQSIKLNENLFKDQINEEKFKEPADKIKYELDKLIKSQSITSQLVDKLIIDDNRKEKIVQNVLEIMKNEFKNQDPKTIDLIKLKLEDKLKEELEKIKLEKEQEEEKHRKELEEKIKEEFDSFKQGKIDRFNKRLQKFSQLKPIELIKLMESCFENLNAFVRWPHPIFPARTAKEIVYCIDLIAVCLKRFYQKLEQKSRSNFEFIYKNSLERFILIIQTVNKMLMENSFVDPDLRMNVVEWTEYQEKSWRGVLVSLECSKQINKFCLLNETNDNKLRMLPRRKLSLMINRKRC